MGSKFVYPKRRNNHFVYEWWIECLQEAAARHSLFFGHLMSQQLTTLHQVGRGTLVDGVTWVCSAAAPAEEQIEVKCLETTDWGDIETVMKWPLPLFLFFFSSPFMALYSEVHPCYPEQTPPVKDILCKILLNWNSAVNLTNGTKFKTKYSNSNFPAKF